MVEIHKKRWKKSRTQEKHAADWVASLKRYAYPFLADKPVSSVSPRDCLDVLEPLWTEKPRTAERVRHRMGAVMRWAMLQGYRADDPTGRVLDGTLAKAQRPVHFQALPHADVADAISLIRASEGWPFTKLLLEFLILTPSDHLTPTTAVAVFCSAPWSGFSPPLTPRRYRRGVAALRPFGHDRAG